jgi:hypothetical protein
MLLESHMTFQANHRPQSLDSCACYGGALVMSLFGDRRGPYRVWLVASRPRSTGSAVYDLFINQSGPLEGGWLNYAIFKEQLSILPNGSFVKIKPPKPTKKWLI